MICCGICPEEVFPFVPLQPWQLLGKSFFSLFQCTKGARDQAVPAQIFSAARPLGSPWAEPGVHLWLLIKAIFHFSSENTTISISGMSNCPLARRLGPLRYSWRNDSTSVNIREQGWLEEKNSFTATNENVRHQESMIMVVNISKNPRGTQGDRGGTGSRATRFHLGRKQVLQAQDF